MKRLLMLLVPMAVVWAAGGCDEIPVNERYGQLLSPGEVEKCPAGCTPYVTAAGDRLYVIADRAYGKGYKMHRIMTVEENKDTLKAITKPDGTLEKGKIIFLPNDERGNTIEPEKRWYFGGTSRR